MNQSKKNSEGSDPPCSEAYCPSFKSVLRAGGQVALAQFPDAGRLHRRVAGGGVWFWAGERLQASGGIA